ncbi:MAG: M48 family metallopeptidase [Candidatus Scalindua sp.]|nr:M48 family metallopeptidase [Candidatus Scalindua sp.]
MVKKNSRTTIFTVSLLVLILFFAIGCANTGPPISKNELEQLEDEIEKQAAGIYVNNWGRVWEVGVNVLNTLPDGIIKKRAAIGALIGDNSEEIARLFNLSSDKGCVVLRVAPDSIAEEAGLKVGDYIKTIDGEVYDDCKDSVFEADKTHIVVIERGGDAFSYKVKPVETPYVRIVLKETGTINAYAGFSGIVFTLGLVNFVEDDNELAVIMGHELAHLTSKHIPRNLGMAALCGIFSGITGPFAPLTYKSLYGPYSRDNEREADYLGLLYAHRAGYDIEKGVGLWRRFALEMPMSRSKSFLRNHPASTERLLRVKKTVELVKSGN